MKWFAADCRFRSHPKFMLAGFWGANAVLAAWEMAKAFDAPDGDVTKHWRVDHIRSWLQLPVEFVEHLKSGMDAAVEHGLIDERDGGYYIHKWSRHQRQSFEAIRKQNYRERQLDMSRSVPSCPDSSQNVPENVSDKDKDSLKKHTARAIYGTTEPPGVEVPPEEIPALGAFVDSCHADLVKAHPKIALANPIKWDQMRCTWLMPAFRIKQSCDLGEARKIWSWAVMDRWEAPNMVKPYSFSRFADRIDELRLKMNRDAPEKKKREPLVLIGAEVEA